MKTIVVSAVNIRKGGTLTILRNCLEYLSGLAQNTCQVWPKAAITGSWPWYIKKSLPIIHALNILSCHGR